MTGHDTHERILETARRLFHERGFNDVGINDICREAGVVKGSFYHFFSGKQALLEGVVKSNDDALRCGLAELAGEARTGREFLVAQLEAIVAEARAQKGDGGVLGCNLGNLATELATSNKGARRTLRVAFRAWRRTLERGVNRGIADGSLPDHLDARETATALLAIIQGASTLGRTFDDPRMLDEIVRQAGERLIPSPD